MGDAYVQNVSVSRSISLKLADGRYIKPDVSLMVKVPEGADPEEAVKEFTGKGSLLERMWLREAISQVAECEWLFEHMGDYDDILRALNERLNAIS